MSCCDCEFYAICYEYFLGVVLLACREANIQAATGMCAHEVHYTVELWQLTEEFEMVPIDADAHCLSALAPAPM